MRTTSAIGATDAIDAVYTAGAINTVDVSIFIGNIILFVAVDRTGMSFVIAIKQTTGIFRTIQFKLFNRF